MTRSNNPLPWETVPSLTNTEWTEVLALPDGDRRRGVVVHIARSRGLAEMRAEAIRCRLHKSPLDRPIRVITRPADADRSRYYTSGVAGPESSKFLAHFQIPDARLREWIAQVHPDPRLPQIPQIPKVPSPAPQERRIIPAATVMRLIDEIDVFTAHEALMTGRPIPKR